MLAQPLSARTKVPGCTAILPRLLEPCRHILPSSLIGPYADLGGFSFQLPAIHAAAARPWPSNRDKEFAREVKYRDDHCLSGAHESGFLLNKPGSRLEALPLILNSSVRDST